MRLINSKTYEFKEYQGRPGVDYAILSHVWRDQEILYSEMLRGPDRGKLGYIKLRYLCEQATHDGYKWVWIDTACIDKSSSAELSEAINSMYAWYQNAAICYVYLDDVDVVNEIPACKWITRGWTLQELLAPYGVHFYSKTWKHLGSKHSLSYQLSKWTGIEQIVLRGVMNVRNISVANRMSWAAKRKTTRVEDVAYCLLGIFGVNMPLLYGEGHSAFSRLMEEILKHSDDQSILCFNHSIQEFAPMRDGLNFLPSSPLAFSGMKVVSNPIPHGTLEVTKAGLKIAIPIAPRYRSGLEKNPIADGYWGILDCRYEGHVGHQIAIALVHDVTKEHENRYVTKTSHKTTFSSNEVAHLKRVEITLVAAIGHHDNVNLIDCFTDPIRNICIVEKKPSCKFSIGLAHSSITGVWNHRTCTSEILCLSDDILIRTFVFEHKTPDVAFSINFMNKMSCEVNPSTYKKRRKDTAHFAYQVKPHDVDFNVWLNDITSYQLNQPTDVDWLICGSPQSRWFRPGVSTIPLFLCTVVLSKQGCEFNLDVIVHSNKQESSTIVWTIELAEVPTSYSPKRGKINSVQRDRVTSDVSISEAVRSRLELCREPPSQEQIRSSDSIS